MEIVTYPKTLQWVGELHCPKCHKTTPAWRSSGMSESYPHFYCNRCSNVMQRRSDQELVWANGPTPQLVEQIAATLPECPCGGRFAPSANPKCKHCGAECPHNHDPVQRLTDPNMIIVDGAAYFSDWREPYQVKIVEKDAL